MANIWNEPFDSLAAWTQQNGAAISLVSSPTFGGTSAVRFLTVGTSTYLQRGLPASCRMTVGRHYFYVSAAPSAALDIYRHLRTAGGDVKFNMDATRAITPFLNVTGGTASPTLTGSAWHWLDYRFTTSTGTATIDWAVDDVLQTQLTAAQAASDMTFVRIGCVSTNTIDYVVDEHRLTDASGDFMQLAAAPPRYRSPLFQLVQQ